MNRRTFLMSAAVAGAGLAVAGPVPVSGPASPDLAPFDEMMRRFLAEHDIPGAALAVSRQGKLVYARGFGLADRDDPKPVRPDTRFRIASISKPITAAAVLRLADRGKFALDDRLTTLLPLAPAGDPDIRLKDVIVRHLLQHTAGWDRDKSGDPMFKTAEVARVVGVESPPGAIAAARYALGRSLDSDPGATFHYSNVGYCILGRLIEHVTGKAYEAHVREHVLVPVGATRMFCGRSLPGDRLAGEARYYEAGEGDAVVGPARKVPWPDGGFYLEAMDAHGAWVASAPDLVRFADAFNDPEHCPLMGPELIRAMFAPPSGRPGHDADGKPRSRYYGCGWSVVRVGDGGRMNTFHTGSLPGTSTILVRRHDGLNWAVLFNTRNGGGDKEPSRLIDSKVHQAADAVTRWPDRDLYRR